MPAGGRSGNSVLAARGTLQGFEAEKRFREITDDVAVILTLGRSIVAGSC